MPALRTRTVSVAGFLFLMHGLAVCRADQPEATKNPVEMAFALVNAGKPLAAVALLEGAAGNSTDDPEALGTLLSFVGEWRGAHQAMTKSYPRPREEAADFSHGVVPCSALDAIAEQAKNHRVVIVNEAHHVPQHRAFLLQLLPKLRSQGFKYYAAETLSEDPRVTHNRGYPVRNTGFYTAEPVFGELIREALAMGFELVAYEAMVDASTASAAPDDPLGSINMREKSQCQNLMDRLFTKDPGARVVVHVGYDHAMERARKLKDGKEILWMAARLAHALDQDLLTVDQTLHTERAAAALATPQWRVAKKNDWLEQPIVLRAENGAFLVTGHFAGLVDMQVFHPPTILVDGRPDWLGRAIGRVPVAIPEEVHVASGRVLIQAFLAGEGDDAVPLDQTVLRPGEPRPKLLLKPGRYRLVVQDEQGNEVLRRPLMVANDTHPKAR